MFVSAVKVVALGADGDCRRLVVEFEEPFIETGITSDECSGLAGDRFRIRLPDLHDFRVGVGLVWFGLSAEPLDFGRVLGEPFVLGGDRLDR